MSVVVGVVVEVGALGRRHGARIKTAFGNVTVGRTKDCARALARVEYFEREVTVEVDDADGRVLSVTAVST